MSILCMQDWLTYYSSYIIHKNLARPPWGREGILFPSYHIIFAYEYSYIPKISAYLDTRRHVRFTYRYARSYTTVGVVLPHRGGTIRMTFVSAPPVLLRPPGVRPLASAVGGLSAPTLSGAPLLLLLIAAIGGFPTTSLPSNPRLRAVFGRFPTTATVPSDLRLRSLTASRVFNLRHTLGHTASNFVLLLPLHAAPLGPLGAGGGGGGEGEGGGGGLDCGSC